MLITSHRKQEQIEIINKIEKMFTLNQLSAVAVVDNYESDLRICLTSVHLPHKQLLNTINGKIIRPLQKLSKNVYFYPLKSLHITIKNIRTINNPPNFTKDDVEKAKQIFSEVIPKHKKFNIYFHKLTILPNSLSLMCFTDPELDKIFLDLDENLNKTGVPDNKIYANRKNIICNITIARFYNKPILKFKKLVKEINNSSIFDSYQVDSISLITANAALKKFTNVGTWNLQ
jgi:2'-5' RNA ligase